MIADIREVTKKDDEDELALAFQFIYPYNVDIEDKFNFLAESTQTEDVEAIASPSLVLYPWMPLSATKEVFVRLDEVVSIYEPHSAVATKYNELLEKTRGESQSTSAEERVAEPVPSGSSD